jgi:hypothetical protein
LSVIPERRKAATCDLLRTGAVKGCRKGKTTCQPSPVDYIHFKLPLKVLPLNIAGTFRRKSFGGVSYLVLVCDKAPGRIDDKPVKANTDIYKHIRATVAERSYERLVNAQGGVEEAAVLH